MTDGIEPEFARFETGYDPADPVDTAIIATRSAVFPERGMIPELSAAILAWTGNVNDQPRREPGRT